MLITIRTTSEEPLEGKAAADDQEAVPFVGWLGLLRTLSELLRSGDEVPAPNGLGGELDT